MFATHNPKTLNSQLSQAPITATISSAPVHLLCSANVTGQNLWAAPCGGAAQIRVAREETQAMIDSGADIEIVIPDLTDGRVKQLLLPYLGSYVALSPLPSGKVMRQVHERIKVMQVATASDGPFLYSYMRKIQINNMASNNHGDPVATSGGKVRLIKQTVFHVSEQDPQPFPESGVLITADMTALQVSSNYVQAGLPAITAIGGAVHVIERATGLDLPFAVGFDAIDPSLWITGKRGTNFKHPKKVVMALITDEITSNTKIYLFLRCPPQHAQAVIDAASLNRIGGGTVWNMTALAVTANKHLQPACRWLMPLHAATGEHSDVLDAMLEMRRENPATIGITQTGYALLHEPRQQAMSRADSKLHAWAEPVFSACHMHKDLTNQGFWQLKNDANVLHWDAVE